MSRCDRRSACFLLALTQAEVEKEMDDELVLL